MSDKENNKIKRRAEKPRDNQALDQDRIKL